MIRTDNQAREPVTEEMLSAYLDGELEPVQRLRLESYLSRNPAAADHVDGGDRLASALHRLFDTGLNDRLTADEARLAGDLERQLERQSRRRRRGIQGAAIATGALTVICAALAWTHAPMQSVKTDALSGWTDETAPSARRTFPNGAASASQPVLQVSRKAQNVAVPETTDPVATAAEAPDFTAQGFALTEARAWQRADTRFRSYAYTSPSGRHLQMVYSVGGRTEAGTGASADVTVLRRGPIAALLWSGGDRNYTLVGTVAHGTLVDLSNRLAGSWPPVAGANAPDPKGKESEPLPDARNQRPDKAPNGPDNSRERTDGTASDGAA